MSARLRGIARETVEIVERGRYAAPSGRTVDLRADVDRAVAGTVLYGPDDPLPEPPAAASGTPARPPVVEVTGESTLAAARRLVEREGAQAPACLVFASARNPGGGFLNGAQAQEEALARSSALYACQTAAPAFYADHRADRDLRYSDRVIYAPDVPVLRDDRGALLELPYRTAFLTAAAPNRGQLARQQPEHLPTVPDTLRRRAARVAAVAAAHGRTELVLGAWGCGVFMNRPREVAEAFAAAVGGEADGAIGGLGFRRVVFAVLDRRGDTLEEFRKVFG